MEGNTLKINVSQEPEKPKFDEWEIKNAVRTLIEAEEIKGNAELMAFVAPELEKQAKATKSAAEILYGDNTQKQKEDKQ